MKSPPKWPILLLLSTVVTISGSLQASDSGPEADFFERRIRPVLTEQCRDCHGSESPKGSLQLDTKAHLLKGGEHGPAIVTGKPAESLLLQAVTPHSVSNTDFPKHPKLSLPQLADFEHWIRDGAPWPAVAGTPTAAKPNEFNLGERKQKQPWLWQPPAPQQPPAVNNTRWPLGAEDHFILQRLEAAGLSPAPEADRGTWLRRVHFVITGLPPSREDLHDFLADPRPDARERVVDQLLASPHFGERWARHWMDLVRYAESRGHEGDYIIANAWHYRDYLIRAFNTDVRYNQFLLEHLAGDLLPRPRLRDGTDINESVLATGWAFLGEENHSPVDIRQDECERIDNKVDVLSKTFLGLTVACARCHDHKFDPIRAQDYYALSGFMLGSSFRQVRFEAMENNRALAAELTILRTRDLPPMARTMAAARAKGIGQIAANLLAARGILAAESSPTPTVNPAPSRRRATDSQRLHLWADHLRQAATNSNHPLHVLAILMLDSEAKVPHCLAELPTANRPSLPVGLPSEAHIIADYTTPGRQPWKVDGEAFGSRPLFLGELVVSTDPTNPIARVMTYGAARRDLFWSRLKNAPANENDSGRLAATTRAGQMLRTPTVTLGTGRLHYLIRGKMRVYAAVDSHLMIEGPLHSRLVEVFDGGLQSQPRWVSHDLTPYSGHRVHVEFGPEGDGELEVLMVVEAAEPPKWLPPVRRFEPSASVRSFADLAMEFQQAAATANQRLGRDAIAKSPETAALANWLVQNPELFVETPDPATRHHADHFFAGQSEIASRVRWESSTAPGWFDGTGVDENILLRGKPFQPGALSPRSLPAAFASARPITVQDSSGRYELGRQLIDPANPLVARVMVNRIWHHLFGRGLVASVDNFGALGYRPTHPELLDHLAWQFAHGDQWSVKRLIRRLVLTRTFAMSSRPGDPRSEELDPANALLHRMPVRRLEGEVIRDSLLTVSGRLNPTVYGPPVPVHLTEFTVGRGRPEQGGPLDGDGRRSVYTAMRRNFLPTLMQTFDAPTPFSTVGRRNVSNVPAQSLALMNDPLIHQQARVWAERLLQGTRDADASTRVRWLFESAFARQPDDAEADACLELLGELGPARDVATEPNVEAWSELCHALFNANDFIYVK
jgi:hypothetical protein